MTRDYILISLLTGARKSNVLSMKWKDIDFDEALWKIPETKNGDPQTIPLSTQSMELLLERKEEANSIWVFPSASSKIGHLVEPKRTWQALLKKANLEDVRLHDLRRTHGSWQAITGASSFIIGKALGHKSQSSTAIYARLDTDPVRISTQKATDEMLSKKLKVN
jgi:integrase